MKPLVLEREMITPEKAKQFLARGYVGQRKLNMTTVNQYARDMASGNWNTYATDPIMLSTQGELLNAQHRLHAIIESGQSIVMPIQKDVPPSAFEYIDNGRPRLAKDFVSSPFSGDVASLAKRCISTIYGANMMSNSYKGVLRYKQTGNTKVSETPTRTEVTSFVKDHYDTLLEIVRASRRIHSHFKACSVPVLAYAIWLIRWLKLDDRLNDFCDDLCALNPSSATCAALHKKFYEVKMQRGARRSVEWYLYVVLTAYEYYRQGGRKVGITKTESVIKQYDDAIRRKRQARRK